VDPWLTNKDGKQDAKEDDDEHEIEQHGSDRDGPLRTTTVLPTMLLPMSAATLLRLALALGTVKWDEPLDECAPVHNNTNMKYAPLARVLPITANLARFQGATG
jgi:hypothetical protein